MWEMILLLWLAPLAFAIVALARLAEGSPPVTDDELRLCFGEDQEIRWLPWLLPGLFALAVIFFGIGFFEGLVVVNFSSFWIITAPLATAIAAVLLLGLCLRHASRSERVETRDSPTVTAHRTRFLPR